MDHGKAELKSSAQLKTYIAFYGIIHKQKLDIAYSHLKAKLQSIEELSIIDWGSGQGLATIIFTEFIDKNYDRNIEINDVYLIDPSETCLLQANSYLQWILPKSELYLINKKASDLDKGEIRPDTDVVIHLLSNIIDIPEFEYESIIKFIELNFNIKHIIVCCSPFYPKEGRGRFMEEFCAKLECFSSIFSLEKHINEWNKDFSCQIKILCNY